MGAGNYHLRRLADRNQGDSGRADAGWRFRLNLERSPHRRQAEITGAVDEVDSTLRQAPSLTAMKPCQQSWRWNHAAGYTCWALGRSRARRAVRRSGRG